ncbi:MAG: hypothetical protein IJ094_10790 [Bacilli bacterium]|nr:hypothetical protein [Bacilli bacterium]
MDYKVGQVVYYRGRFNRLHEVEIIKIKEIKRFLSIHGNYYYEYEILVRYRKNGKLKVVDGKDIF